MPKTSKSNTGRGTVSIRQLKTALGHVQRMLEQVQKGLNRLDETNPNGPWNEHTPITIDPGPKTANIFGTKC
jgi:hypothetical protein